MRHLDDPIDIADATPGDCVSIKVTPELQRIIRRGVTLLGVSRKPRNDALSRLIGAAMASAPDAGHLELIGLLWSFDADNEISAIIQEIESDQQMIYWLDDRDRERKTSFDAVRKRMDRLSRRTHKH